MYVLKQLDNRGRRNRTIGVAAGHAGEKGGENEEDILPVSGKSEEAGDSKKYLKMV